MSHGAIHGLIQGVGLDDSWEVHERLLNLGLIGGLLLGGKHIDDDLLDAEEEDYGGLLFDGMADTQRDILQR